MLAITICAALSAAGLAVAFLTAYRRRFAAALRLAGIALVPVGLALSGLIGLAGKIGRAVGGWAAGLVLDPTVWSGFGVLAVAVVLFVVGRAAGRRSRGRSRTRTDAGRADRSAGPGALARREELPLDAGASAPSEAPARQRGGTSGQSSGGDDFSEIEAILKKHGI